MQLTMSIGRFLLIAALLALAAGCARMPDTGETALKPATLGALRANLLDRKFELDEFRLRGPYAVTSEEDFEIRLSVNESVNTNLFLSAHREKAPLVILLHGYEGSKEDHAYQAMHLASWGIHCLVLQLPNNGPWSSNGRTLANLVNFIHRWPEIIDNRVDLDKLILVGYSFGGSSVAVALAEGARAMGGILLDPAGIGRELPAYLGKINSPMMLLGADERVFAARNRDYFFDYIRGGVAEISINGADHDDATFPLQFALATSEAQIEFVSTLTLAAFSLSTTGGFEYAWRSLDGGLKSGKFIKARKK